MARTTRAAARGSTPASSIPTTTREAIAWLEQHATTKYRDGMARYALPSEHALGVPMGVIQQLAKQMGRNHALALELWETGVYEGRMLASYVAEPDKVTPALMDRWCRDFDNWGVCDTVCFVLFDRTPHALKKVAAWSRRRAEFEKRAAFALLASVALHDKRAADAVFLKCLPLIETAASDDRNFVKKGVSWALRGIAARNAALRAASMQLARKLATSELAGARWVGKDVVRQLTKAKRKA